MLSERDIRNVLRHRCEAAGSQNKWAKEHGFSNAFVSHVLSGKREISPRMADALGYQRIVQFRSCISDSGKA